MEADDAPHETFLGIRFALFGFDPNNEETVRSKLVDGGGVDVGQINRKCTHVIVDKLVYDDPICATARKNGKKLVTGLWVDHSFDIGMPVDTASIMYRPLKDLNGIPGAKELIMCLTGYQRQDRDDIMTMVSLMGAHFSKPLVATKVTHLICYKFEGEKYELAKKLKRIKLVNHRWLEDCLRDWELLPEDNYNRSGYELEMLEAEAEAKDSEDEAEDGNLTRYGNKKVNKSPHTPSVATTRDELKSVKPEFPRHSTELEEKLSNAGSSKIPTNEKEDILQQLRYGTVNVPGLSDCEGTAAYRDATAVNLSDSLNKPPILKNVEKNSASTSRSSKRSPESDVMSYSRKNSRKSSLPLASPQLPSSNDETLHANRIIVKTPEKENSDQEKERNGLLPQKRSINSSNSSPKLLKMSSNAKTHVRGSPPVTLRTRDNEGTGLDVDMLETLNNAAPEKKNQTTNIDVSHISPSSVSKINSSFDKKSITPRKSLTKPVENTTSLHTSPKELRNSTSASKPNKETGKSAQLDEETLCLEVERQDAEVSLPKDREVEVENFHTDLPQGKIDKLISKPGRKKTVAKKTLGTRPKLSNSANKRGSLHSLKSLGKNDSAICSHEKDKKAENETSIYGNVLKTSHQTVNDVAPTDFGDDIINMFKYTDDDTEAPEENQECEVENKLDEKKSLDAGPSEKLEVHNADEYEPSISNVMAAGEEVSRTKLSTKVSSGKPNSGKTNLKKDGVEEKVSKEKKHSTGKLDEKNSLDASLSEKLEVHNADRYEPSTSNVVAAGEDIGRTILDNAVSSGNPDSGKRNLKKDGAEEKVGKGKKHSTGKTNVKTVPASRSKKNTDGKRAKTENNNEKKGKKHFMAKQNDALPADTLEKPVIVEKENQPVIDESTNLSLDKEQVGKKSKIKSTSGAKKINSDSHCVGVADKVKNKRMCFILTGDNLQRKAMQQVITRLKGRFCSGVTPHSWTYQATHFICTEPVRRIEKFFAAAASGRWILKVDYLNASNEAGKFLDEEPYEWHKKGFTEDGNVNLEAPRKWRLLREKTGYGAFYGMRMVVYGECIAPTLDSLKRVVKAGDGTILATSPPYSRFLKSGVDFAIVSRSMPEVDMHVQEFLQHEIPCVTADYFVEYICKPGCSLEKNILFNTNSWAEKSYANMQNLAVAEEVIKMGECSTPPSTDVPCEVCGSLDRGEVMLLCGNESGSIGCGVGTHIDCCDPPLEEIPEEDWFCPNCRESSIVKPMNKKRNSSVLKCR
ncbi:hypothetical protein ACFE04_016830 [Oxalis oulophora]